MKWTVAQCSYESIAATAQHIQVSWITEQELFNWILSNYQQMQAELKSVNARKEELEELLKVA